MNPALLAPNRGLAGWNQAFEGMAEGVGEVAQAHTKSFYFASDMKQRELQMRRDAFALRIAEGNQAAMEEANQWVAENSGEVIRTFLTGNADEIKAYLGTMPKNRYVWQFAQPFINEGMKRQVLVDTPDGKKVYSMSSVMASFPAGTQVEAASASDIAQAGLTPEEREASSARARASTVESERFISVDAAMGDLVERYSILAKQAGIQEQLALIAETDDRAEQLKATKESRLAMTKAGISARTQQNILAEITAVRDQRIAVRTEDLAIENAIQQITAEKDRTARDEDFAKAIHPLLKKARTAELTADEGVQTERELRSSLNRLGLNAVLGNQALREAYVKGFANAINAQTDRSEMDRAMAKFDLMTYMSDEKYRDAWLNLKETASGLDASLANAMAESAMTDPRGLYAEMTASLKVDSFDNTADGLKLFMEKYRSDPALKRFVQKNWVKTYSAVSPKINEKVLSWMFDWFHAYHDVNVAQDTALNPDNEAVSSAVQSAARGGASVRNPTGMRSGP
jgi:hypothetical protein